jgi:hypothetical protein
METRKRRLDCPGPKPRTVAPSRKKHPVLCVHGVEGFGKPIYCDEHKPSPSGQIKARWEKWREEGIDPTHGGEVAKKQGEAISRSNRQKPRQGGKTSVIA